MFRKLTIRLSARAPPGTERTRSTRDSGKAWLKSTFGVFFEVTQRSASMCSTVTEALSSRPRKSPTWNRTSRTANATPATVMANRVRSCRSVLRARSTMVSSQRAMPRMSVSSRWLRRGLIGRQRMGAGAGLLLTMPGARGACARAHGGIGQGGEVALADLAQERILVREILVDGGGGVFDAPGDLAHADRLDALAREHLAGRPQDLLPQTFLLPLSALCRAHASSERRSLT